MKFLSNNISNHKHFDIIVIAIDKHISMLILLRLISTLTIDRYSTSTGELRSTNQITKLADVTAPAVVLPQTFDQTSDSEHLAAQQPHSIARHMAARWMKREYVIIIVMFYYN